MKNLLYLGALAFLASCNSAPNANQEEAATETVIMEIKGEEVTYSADSITMKGFMAYNAADTAKKPVVLVVHEWWGHNEHARKSAMKLAEMGYLALAVDMYGEGKTADHPQDAMAFSSAVFGDFAAAKNRFEAALQLIKSMPMANAEQTAAIGYCFGGGIVLNMARQGVDLDAVASFHGSLGAVSPAEKGKVSTQVLVLNGEDDPFVTAEQIAAFKAEMDSAAVNYEFVNYPGAIHAFTNPNATEMGQKFDLPLAYNAEADSMSWAKMSTFLAATFGK